MSYLADDTAAIKARMEEIKAERQLAQTGSNAPEQPKEFDAGYAGGIDYADVGIGYVTMKSAAHPEWPYAGTAHEWRGFVKT